MSMPNGVPQSPMWFSRTTSCPTNVQRPHQAVADDRRAQVADVHLLGDVGRRVVDHEPLGAPTPAGPPAARRSRPRRPGRPGTRAWNVTLMKPGPASSAVPTPARSTAASTASAISRGGRPSVLASGERAVGLGVGPLGRPDHRVGTATGHRLEGGGEQVLEEHHRVGHSNGRWYRDAPAHPRRVTPPDDPSSPADRVQVGFAANLSRCPPS